VLLNLTVGASTGTATQLQCLPGDHDFTWADAIDPINSLAWGMGLFSGSRRSLVGVDFFTGETKYDATEGDANSGAYSPYNLAADPETMTMYAIWEAAQLDPIIGCVTVNLTTGAPTLITNFTYPPGEDFCSADVSLAFNSANWDGFRKAYVTIWSCSNAIYLWRVYPNTQPLQQSTILLVKDSDDSLFVQDLNVDLTTGSTYVMMTDINMNYFTVYLVEGPDMNSTVTAIISIGNPYPYEFGHVVAFPFGACVYQPNDNTGSEIPTLTCQVDYSPQWVTSFPDLATSDLRSLDHPTVVQCPE